MTPALDMSTGGARPADDCDRMRDLRAGHASAVLRYLMHLTVRDRHLSEELLQETMLRAWQSLHTLPPETNLRPWLYTVARRIAVDAMRTRRVRPAEAAALNENMTSTGRDLEVSLTSDVVKNALLRLSAEHRRIIVELYLRGRTVAETAELLGISPGTVKELTFHAMRALHASIDDGRL